jgi:hypothetical protein
MRDDLVQSIIYAWMLDGFVRISISRAIILAMAVERMKQSIHWQAVGWLIAIVSVVVHSSAQTAAESANQSAFLTLSNGSWRVLISPSNGAVSEINNISAPSGMNWVHVQRPWGLLELGEGTNRMVFNHPLSVKSTDARTLESVYEADNIKLAVRRSIDAQDQFTETYTLENTGASPRSFPSGSTFLTIPFNDSYKAGAPACLLQNCDAHLWAGGSSSWVHAGRMGGAAPHLGLVLTKGNLAGYSILDGADSNDRGNIAFNPSTFELKPGEAYVIAWQLFWHDGWPDFWSKVMAQTNFVRLQAAHYSVVQGQPLEFSAESSSALDKAIVRLNGKVIPVKHAGKYLSTSIDADSPGEKTFELDNRGQISWLKANVIVDPLTLIEARVRFITTKQQRNAPGNLIDGAYLAYDNETGQQVVDKQSDHNEARERIGMGVLVALYLPLCKDPELKQQIRASVEKYEAFIEREIQDTNGIVYNSAGYKYNHRRYNAPWVAHLHLAMYWATHDRKYLDWYVKTVRAYYGKNRGINFRFFPIGQQMLDSLDTLKDAGMTAEHDDLLEIFTNHADTLAKLGGGYPKSEVNYEQSIVGPGVQIELEMYLATHDSKYLANAKRQLVYLEAFNGAQPDYRLNDVAIRHWDDYWFGKLRLNGDTMPQYWSTISALAFDEYAAATGDKSYCRRAQDILLNNMCLFTPAGSASCAYLYPLKIGSQDGQRFDPWANDQDWVLVNWLTLQNRHK